MVSSTFKRICLFAIAPLLTFICTDAMIVPHSSKRSDASQVVYERLAKKKVDYKRLGCQCMMTSPSVQNTDTTMCACINRQDGSTNDSNQCRPYTDTIFGFCYEVTDSTDLWQTCVNHYCPYSKSENQIPPENKIIF